MTNNVEISVALAAQINAFLYGTGNPYGTMLAQQIEQALQEVQKNAPQLKAVADDG